MLIVSAPNISDVIKELDGVSIENVTITYTGKTRGIQALFEAECNETEQFKDSVKKYLKGKFPYLRFFLEFE